MDNHLQAPPRTPGGAVDPRSPRKGSFVRKPVFPVYPLIAAGGLCITFLLALSQPEQSPESDTAKSSAARQRPGGAATPVEPGMRAEGHAEAADPAGELAGAFTIANQSERDRRVRDLLSGWDPRDIESALRWVSSLEEPAARRSVRSSVCFALAEEDPRQAVVLALALRADEDEDRGLLECLTMRWCDRDSEAALSWACEQPPGEWRDRLLASASFILSKSDPASAAHLVSGLEPGTVQDEAAMAVLHQWALKDSAAALQWAEAFPASPLRERALAEISNLQSHLPPQ